MDHDYIFIPEFSFICEYSFLYFAKADINHLCVSLLNVKM